jgi:PKD repeat protein
MTLPTVNTRRAFTPPVLFVLAMLCLATLWPARLDAQCTVSSPVSFEPSPPGEPRPTSLAAAKNYDLVLFQSGGIPHMLMQESFGYSILQLSNPANPTAILYDNMRLTGEMPAVGDGQSYIGSIAASSDGARLALGLNGNAQTEYGSVAATGSGGTFNSITGGFMPRNSGTVVQGVGSRYLAYSLTFFSGLSVADITNIPGPLAPANVSSEQVEGVGGTYLTIAGNNILYLDLGGTIRIYDASNPGPVGNIGGSLARTTLGSADFAGRVPTSFSAAMDPGDSTKLWVLVELPSPLSWALVSVKGGAKTVNSQTFAVPQPSGETWVAGGVSALIPNGQGGLFALMWAKKFGSPVVYRLFSQSTQGWGTTPSQFDINSSSYPSFGLNYFMRGLPGAGPLLYAYVPTGLSAYVLPMSCVSNAPAIASMAVTDQAGTPLADGATVFLGDAITIAPTVNPPTSLQPLTGFGWNFDFDFHSGVASEDNGTTSSPRLHAPDNATLGSPATPPAVITLVGPCDPQVAGTSPGGGTGCWASVTGNAAFAGGTADFTGAEPAGTTKPLKFAFEANNILGSAGATTFTLNWKVPAARLRSTQILSGSGALDATASDGHPSASGYKWYFGDSPSSLSLSACTTATCVPPLQATGPHYYWVTVPYSQIGYSTAECPGAPSSCTSNLGSYVITDFAPAFTVNGSATGPVTAVVGTALALSNLSQRGATVTGAGGYYYYLCAIPCSAPTLESQWVLWGTMGDAPPSGSPAYPATIPSPGVGSWGLYLRVKYVNPTGTAYWPDPSGATGITLNVTSCTNPDYHITVGGSALFPNGGFSVQAGQAVTFIPNDAYPPLYSWNFGDGSALDTNQSPTHTYSGAGNYTVTFSAAGGACSVSYPMAVTNVNPLSVGASASPNPASVNASVNFTCNATGGSGGYNYTWTNAVSGSGPSVSKSFGSAATYQAQCNVTDSTGTQRGAVVNLVVQAAGGGSCTTADFHISVDGGPQYSSFTTATGHVVTFIPNASYSGWSWSFGDGATASIESPTHTYSGPGTYTVSMTANGCTRSYQIVVTGTGGGGPSSACTTVDFSILDGATGLASCGPFGCSGISGAALSFVPNPAMTVPFTSWSFGDGSTSTTSQGTHTYAGGGAFTVTLAAGTCTKTKEITISGPVALSGSFVAKYADNSAFQATQVASGKAVTFLAIDTADTYTWDFGDGTSPATGQTPSHSYVTPGTTAFTYTATLSVTRGTGTSAQNASTTQSFTIIPPPEPPKWFVAGLAYLQGALEGTLWKTDLTLFNPDQGRPGTYSLAFLDGRAPVDPANLVWKTITVGAQQSVSAPNVLEFFGQPLGSYGALLVRGDSAPVPPVLTSRTFNSGDPAKGTFGLSVQSTQPSSGLTPQAALSQQFLIGLRDDDTAYTNIGLMNLTTDWSHARLSFLDRSGATSLGQVNVDVPPYGVAQLTRPLFKSPPDGVGFPDPLDTFSVKVTVLSGGSIFPYASVIDRRSTDAVVVTVYDRPSSTYRMPGIIRAQGANNTVWRSRFYITNPSNTSRKASISYSFIPCDATGCKSRVTGLQSDVTLLPGETLWADDFPKVWLSGFGFGVSDTTAYQFSYVDVFPAAGDPNQEPLVVLGETYNDQPGGPVGLQVPGFTDADAASKTGANKRLLLAGLVSNASYRSNLALFLQSGTSSRCTVRVLSDLGVEVARQDVGFDSTATFHQLNDSGLFGSLSGNQDRFTVIVDSIEGAPIAAYATIIDNTSGDATFLKAQPAP